MDVRFVLYLLLYNFPPQPIHVAQQPPNMLDGGAKVAFDHILHDIDNFLAVTVATVPIFFPLQEKFPS